MDVIMTEDILKGIEESYLWNFPFILVRRESLLLT